MGLITKEVILKWNKLNRKWYELKGYTFTKYKDEFVVGVNDLMNGSNVKVKVKCDNCNIKLDMQWITLRKQLKERSGIYCHKCIMNLFATENMRLSKLNNGISFYQWCIENNRQDILELWDYDLNDFKPDEVGYTSNIKCWFKCPDGIHKSELKYIYNFIFVQNKNIKCKQCNSFGQYLTDNYGKNALDIYWSDKNTIDPFKIESLSNKKVWIKCSNCEAERLINICKFKRHGLCCFKCSDGISYPNKLMFNVLEQLNITFISEYSPDWIKPKRYDFYFELNNNKYIIEMDGGWHNQDNNMTGQTKEKSKNIDNYKDRLAKEYNLNIIRIDCDYEDVSNRLDYIKTNISNSNLSKILNLNNIDWLKCHEYSCSSLVKTACDMFKFENKNTSSIMDELKLGRCTVIRYLKQGNALGWCSYNGQEEINKSYRNLSKSVYCIELDKHFASIRSAAKEVGVSYPSISQYLSGKNGRKSAGKHPITGEPLHWMYGSIKV